MLWHKFACLDPPSALIHKLQKRFNDLFWQGIHWIPAKVLYLLLSQGGQGLIYLQSRIFDFRIKYIRNFIYYSDLHSIFLFFKYFLQTIRHLGYDKQLLQLNAKLFPMLNSVFPLIHKSIIRIIDDIDFSVEFDCTLSDIFY